MKFFGSYNLVIQDKLATRRMNLTYVPGLLEAGDIVVHLLKQDIEAKNKKFNKVLIMYVVINIPYIGTVE